MITEKDAARIQRQRNWIIYTCNVADIFITYNQTTQMFDIGHNITLFGSNFSKFEAPIGIVDGDLSICPTIHSRVKSLIGFPKIVTGNFSINSSDLTSLEGIPQIVNGIVKIKNSKKINDAKDIFKWLRGHVTKLSLPDSRIISFTDIECTECVIDKFEFDALEGAVGGLGVLLIPGIKEIGTWCISSEDEWYAFKIIQKYVNRPEDIFACQMELIDSGYGRFAQL